MLSDGWMTSWYILLLNLETLEEDPSSFRLSSNFCLHPQLMYNSSRTRYSDVFHTVSSFFYSTVVIQKKFLYTSIAFSFFISIFPYHFCHERCACLGFLQLWMYSSSCWFSVHESWLYDTVFSSSYTYSSFLFPHKTCDYLSSLTEEQFFGFLCFSCIAKVSDQMGLRQWKDWEGFHLHVDISGLSKNGEIRKASEPFLWLDYILIHIYCLLFGVVIRLHQLIKSRRLEPIK